MLKLILFTTILTLVSCGKKDSDVKVIHEVRPNVTDSDIFKPYKDHFEQVVRNESGSLNFEIGDIPIVLVDRQLLDNPGYVGVCYVYANDKKMIEIKKAFWDYASKSHRKALIMHELGHCRLNRDHHDVVSKGVPLSIMHSHLVDETLFFKMETFYNYELITKDVKPILDYIMFNF